MALGACPLAIAGRDARGVARLAAQASTRRVRGRHSRRRSQEDDHGPALHAIRAG
ncbi:MAG TPA: hypothetical protein VK162_11320 [Streptosporangiaceae bacterium]|nr:hypothetical protein [Streptosporangiaceae bacterium]